MTYVQRLVEKFTEQQIRDAFANAHCRSNAAELLGMPSNGTSKRVLDIMIERYNIDITHFDRGRKHRRYIATQKECPICGLTFLTNVGQKGEKTTCSVGCSNTYFRSGPRNGNFKPDDESPGHRVCWRHHKKECVICGENLIVEAHHHNGDHNDNRPENFVPLCPTHHQYWHSRHRHLIQDKVDAYVQQFIGK